MKARELATKPAVTIDAAATLVEAANLMERANVGALVVMGGDRLVGIVTDRDLVVSGIARRRPLDARVDSVMSTDVVTIGGEADEREAYRVLGRYSVRRLPVVDGGEVIGVLSLDDVLIRLASDFDTVVLPIMRELAFGHHPAQVPAVG